MDVPRKTRLRTAKDQASQHLRDKDHLHRLVQVMALGTFEIGMTLGVEAVLIHLVVTIGLFGRDLVETVLAD